LGRREERQTSCNVVGVKAEEGGIWGAAAPVGAGAADAAVASPFGSTQQPGRRGWGAGKRGQGPADGVDAEEVGGCGVTAPAAGGAAVALSCLLYLLANGTPFYLLLDEMQSSAG